MTIENDNGMRFNLLAFEHRNGVQWEAGSNISVRTMRHGIYGIAHAPWNSGTS